MGRLLGVQGGDGQHDAGRRWLGLDRPAVHTIDLVGVRPPMIDRVVY